ncbi:CaiB/BaiF CoA-transferase family protein [Sebaldella sp. S0638]|uniref:CaiB/BaiF CoA transferase family protein n=1 Tax=Sebaldella sp. S0638 TaxID=2957809 RepID=UPI00209F427F|nr:CoA transferase [Sebaldella sp. S0638]MCP1226618.1 CoA transferase [Sebaldella sp. S0638]
MNLLDGIIILDFSQYLAGPSATLRLADLGARVIKIERPKGGDGSRAMQLKNLVIDDDSLLFHTINRNKESFTCDLKDKDDLEMVKKLITKADILVENFRPGVMDKIGLSYDAVREINPKIIYGTVTGYGSEGPWARKPGQDLLLQAMSGLTWLNGNSNQPPMPFALSITDIYTGIHLSEGILACLFRRFKTGEGGLVQVSLLESILDMQFEVITTYLNDGKKAPKRSVYNNAHAYLSAPYGIYETSDDYIALAMGSVLELGQILDIPELEQYSNPESWFDSRDEIKQLIGAKLRTNTAEYWLDILKKADYWCSDVLNWQQLLESEGFKILDFIQNVKRPDSQDIFTSRCPIRINGEKLKSSKWAPKLGENTENIIKEFKLRGEVKNETT